MVRLGVLSEKKTAPIMLKLRDVNSDKSVLQCGMPPKIMSRIPDPNMYCYGVEKKQKIGSVP
jgi:hypothetical protein